MSSKLRRGGKIISYIVASLLALFLVILLAAAFLLGTTPGTRITLTMADRFAPGSLEWDGLDGHLLNELRLERLQYTDGDLSLTVNQLRFHWRPRALLNKEVFIRSLEFNSLQVSLPETTDTDDAPSDEPFTLPDIELPVDIRVEQAHLRAIDIQIGDFTQHIEEVELQATSSGSFHQIERFRVVAPEGQVRASGNILTSGEYTFYLNVEAQADVPEYGEVTVNAYLEGNRHAAEVNASVGGLADIQVNASVEQYLQPELLQWQGQITLQQLSLPEIESQLESIYVQAQGRGSLTEASVDIEGEAVSYEHGPAELSGRIVYADQRVDIEHLYAEMEDHSAQATISGYAVFSDILDVNIQGEASYLDFSVSEFSLIAQGDPEHANPLELTLTTPQGSAAINGQVRWQPVIEWDLNIDVDNLVLDELHETLSGQLAMQASTQGQFSDTLNVEVYLSSLSGTLLDNELSGQGRIGLSETTVNADNFYLQWGDARFDASGVYQEENIALRWQLAIPDAHALHTAAEGELNASGQLLGTLDSLHVEISAQGDGLGYHAQGLRVELEQFTIDLATESTLEDLPVGSVTLNNLRFNEQRLDSLRLELSGTERQQISLRMVMDELQARLSTEGGWNFEQLRWAGTLDTVELRYPDIGRWNLTEPVAIDASPENFTLDNFCLMVATRESQLCGAARWNADSGDFAVNVDIDDVPYQIFSPFLPDDIMLLGEFSLNADLAQNADTLTSDVRLTISDSSVRIPAQNLRIDFDGGEILQVNGNQDRIDAQLRILSEQLDGGIEAQLTVLDALEDSRTLEGSLGVDINDLSLITALTPDVQNVLGELNGVIRFQGDMEDLTVEGGLELRNGFAELPATGLELRNMSVVIEAPSANNEPFTLNGSLDAGEGQLSFDGSYYLLEQRAELNIAGDAFPALNTRELSVTIAPDIHIEYTPDLLLVRGEVLVPSARITPPDFESVDSISSDTVLVHGEGSVYEQTSTIIPLDMDLTVNLGDDVQVSAFGFEGFLTGGLRIIEQPGQETTAVGNIDVAAGQYEIYGQNLNIERGRLIFTGGPVANPGLDLRVERRIEMDNVTAGARVGGTLQYPTFNLFSSPSMEDSAVLSYLLFGRGPGQGSSGEQNMLARATLALGMTGGNRLGERLSNTLGVDEISLDSGDTFESTALFIGKQISSRLYIKYGVGLVEPVTTFFIQYRLTDSLNFESQTGNEQSGADLFYSIERN